MRRIIAVCYIVLSLAIVLTSCTHDEFAEAYKAGNWEELERLSAELIEGEPNNAKGYAYMALWGAEKERWDEVRDDATKARELDGELFNDLGLEEHLLTAWQNWVLTHFRIDFGTLEEFAVNIDAFYRDFPDDIYAILLEGLLLVEKSEHQDAMLLLNKVIEQHDALENVKLEKLGFHCYWLTDDIEDTDMRKQLCRIGVYLKSEHVYQVLLGDLVDSNDVEGVKQAYEEFNRFFPDAIKLDAIEEYVATMGDVSPFKSKKITLHTVDRIYMKGWLDNVRLLLGVVWEDGQSSLCVYDFSTESLMTVYPGYYGRVKVLNDGSIALHRSFFEKPCVIKILSPYTFEVIRTINYEGDYGVISNDGTRIAHRVDDNLLVTDIETKESTVLLVISDDRQLFNFSWSCDDRYIAYSKDVAHGECTESIGVIDLTGNKLLDIPNPRNGTVVIQPIWYQDNSKILLALNSWYGDYVALLDVNTVEMNVLDDIFAVALSPSSRELAYRGPLLEGLRLGHNKAVLVRDLEVDIVQLVCLLEEERTTVIGRGMCEWSPDGDAIVLVKDDLTGLYLFARDEEVLSKSYWAQKKE